MGFNKAKALQEAERSVSQRRFSQAIQQYLAIAEGDPSDITLLNTVGDLYVREGNLTEALVMFHRLADTYIREGFYVRAIAIYRKIVKLEPNSINSALKLAELYATQKLTYEARTQYALAFDLCQEQDQSEKALETLRKVLALDPENIATHLRVAQYCEQVGRRAEAVQEYLETVRIQLARGEMAAAESALQKAWHLDPGNHGVALAQARQALAQGRMNDVEGILGAVPGLRSEAKARELLLEAYVGANNLEAAGQVALEILRADPGDFVPLASFSTLCCEKGEVDLAVALLGAVADDVWKNKQSGPLVDALRRIRNQYPQHLPTLQLMLSISQQTADDSALREALEALGHAYFQAGHLEQAESMYRRLLEREPNDERCLAMLRQVLEKRGEQSLSPESLAPARTEQGLEPSSPAPDDTDQLVAIAEALGNSDLYLRYGLPKKAVAELEKAVALFPGRIEIHQRLFEICQTHHPARAAQAAAALAGIRRQQGHADQAKRFEELARQYGGALEETPTPLAEPERRQARTPWDLTGELETLTAQQASRPLSPSDQAQAPSSSSGNWDLTGELEALTGAGTTSGQAGPRLFNFDETQGEIDFYLENDFIEEAWAAVRDLEEKFPGSPQVSVLRRRVDEQVRATGGAAVAAASGPQRESDPARAGPITAPPEAVTDIRRATESEENVEAPGSSASPHSPPPPARGKVGDSLLDSLLDDLGTGERRGTPPDPDMHYSLGVAYREMELLDEAIGEFQKAVKGARKGRYPTRYLETCTLLARCFTDKGMPLLAAKWYQHALDAPNLDEDAKLALQYHLGLAYEQAGNSEAALGHFLEVYSQNIDFLDVAERVRQLQQKPT